MIGGGLGPFEPGEWTDDTSMALCIAEVTATGAVDIDAIGDRFLGWARSGPLDIGVSTGQVLGRANNGSALPRCRCRLPRGESAWGGWQRCVDADCAGGAGVPR